MLLPASGYDPDFLIVQLQLSYYRLRAEARGGNQANLNLSLVRSFKVLNPPLPEQRAFSRRMDALNGTGAKGADHLATLDALFASLQHRAFRGEL